MYANERVLVDYLQDMTGTGPRIDTSQYTQPLQGRSDVDCTVCLEGLSAQVDNEVSHCVRLIVCGHGFHAECIDAWLNGAGGNSSTCPECRAVVC